MPQKTIYVSDSDVSLFEEAKKIAGKALSSVIATALKEYVGRQKKGKEMQEISIMVGKPHSEREKRFIGQGVGDWRGFSDNKEWYMSGVIYRTQKGNWAVLVTTIAKGTLFTNKRAWKESGDYLINPRHSELFTGSTAKDFYGRLPKELFETLESIMQQNTTPIEYLDI